MKCVEINVLGVVQGVFFRKYTKETADRLGLSGTVRNQRDGSVQITAYGTDEKVAQLIDWCHSGSPMSNVEQVLVNECVHETNLGSGFNITY